MTTPAPQTTRARRVVVGVDGSPAAAAALRWALDAARRRDLPVLVVHAYLWPVYPPPLLPGSEFVTTGEAGERMAQGIVDDALRTAEELAPDVQVSAAVVRGGAGEVLLEHDKSPTELLVVGSRGRGGFRSLLLGSTSTAVAERAHCPVVVVRHGEAPGGEHFRVVVGVDGSELSELAVGFAMAEAARRGAALEAVTAWNRIDALPPGLLAAGSVDPLPTTEQIALALSESLAGWREKFPEVAVTQRVVVGHPAHVLAEASRYADLVVVGTRGHSAAVSLLLGSTSRAVLHHASSPVAVVPRPATSTG